MVCRLLKSLYGLKQSGRNWHQMLIEHLQELGFKASINDACVFTKMVNNQWCYVSVWVDDIIYFSQDATFKTTFEKQMVAKFIIGEKSQLAWFLGMGVKRTEGRIVLDQRQYVTKLLDNFGMLECKSVATPLAEKLVLTRADCPDDNSDEQSEMKQHDYRGLVGNLNYLATTTRPDIAYAAHALSSYLANPGMVHWTAAKHVLRYLKRPTDYTLVYQYDSGGSHLEAWADSDYAGKIDTKKTTSGFCVKVNFSGAVSGSSKLQQTVAASTAEAETNAISECVKETINFRGLLAFLGYNQPSARTIWSDNQAAIAISGKAKFCKSRTKS